jgi:hypothetical protein
MSITLFLIMCATCGFYLLLTFGSRLHVWSDPFLDHTPIPCDHEVLDYSGWGMANLGGDPSI